MVPSLIYFITGMFMSLILDLMLASCVGAEIVRAATRYESFAGNAVAYAVFGFGMCGSPPHPWGSRRKGSHRPRPAHAHGGARRRVGNGLHGQIFGSRQSTLAISI